MKRCFVILGLLLIGIAGLAAEEAVGDFDLFKTIQVTEIDDLEIGLITGEGIHSNISNTIDGTQGGKYYINDKYGDWKPTAKQAANGALDAAEMVLNAPTSALDLAKIAAQKTIERLRYLLNGK